MSRGAQDSHVPTVSRGTSVHQGVGLCRPAPQALCSSVVVEEGEGYGDS